MTSGIKLNEILRLKYLKDYDILDTEYERAYDDITVLARTIAQTETAFISLIDENRQWFKAHDGWEGARHTPREISLCTHAIALKEPLIVSDATKDPRFRENPLVTGEPYIKFYAGFQIFSKDNLACLGTLCVIDKESQTLSEDQIKSLKILVEQIEALMDVRRKSAITIDELESRINKLKEHHSNKSDLISQFKFLEENIKILRDEIRNSGLENSVKSASILQISILKLNNIYSHLSEITEDEAS